MSGTGEIIGGIAETAMVARAVEPTHGEGTADGHTHESVCLNCGTRLIGSHCHSCGQAAHVHKTLGAFFHDLLHGVFHFEGKIWRTLPMLIRKPGQLTREYIDGRRASYISPIALFLFSVFLMFAMIKQVGSLDQIANVEVNGHSVRGIEANEKEIAKLKQQRDALVRAGKPTTAIDGEITGREQAVKTIRQMEAELKGNHTTQLENVNFHSDLPAVENAWKEFRTNPGLVLYKLQSNAYKFSWALIPISVPFVWLLFPFSRRFRLYDHTVFVTYSLCFMTLLVTAIMLGEMAGAPFMAVLAVLVPPLHMYKQLRGTYALSRFGGLWRTLALVVFANLALTLFAVLILAETGA